MLRDRSDEKLSVERQADALISKVVETGIIDKEKERVKAFLDGCPRHSPLVDKASAVLEALDGFQEKLQRTMKENRKVIVDFLTAYVTSWFVGYDELERYTREDLEHVVDELVAEAFSSLYESIPPYPVCTDDDAEKEFVQMCEEILGELEEAFNGECIVAQVVNDIRFTP